MFRRQMGLLAAAAVLLLATPAAATLVQIDPANNKIVCLSGCAAPTAFAQLGAATLPATTSSARVALPTTDATVVIYNPGTTNAHIKLGNGSVTAAITDLVLPPGISVISNVAANADLAAIMESGSATLQIWTGTGSAQFAPVSSGAGAVTNAGTFAVQNSAAGVAGENHLGEVGGNAINVQVTPTVTAVAFTSGWAVGGLQTIANAARVSGGTGLLQDVQIAFKSTQTTAQAAMDIFLFSDTSLSSTCTNAAAFVLSATDFAKLIGVIHVTDTTAGNTTTLGQALNQAKTYKLAATSMYACAVTRGTPTWGTTSDLTFSYNFIRN